MSTLHTQGKRITGVLGILALLVGISFAAKNATGLLRPILAGAIAKSSHGPTPSRAAAAEVTRPKKKSKMPAFRPNLVPSLRFGAAGFAFNCGNDTGGENDISGQRDLTRYCVDAANIGSGILEVKFNWDVISLSGANTSDACSLFDTDNDGYANYGVCVTIDSNPAAQSSNSPRIYICNDDRPDRCTNSVLVNGPYNTACAVSQVSTDPFSAGDSYPQDTEADCVIDLMEVGGSNAVFIDSCSYPSQQPNSDPADCVVRKANSGRLEVRKVLSPSNDSGLFNLQIDGVTAGTGANVGNNGTTGEIVYDAGTYTIGETAGTGTSLSNYTTAIVCKDLNGTGNTIASSSTTSVSVTLADNADVICTITNTYVDNPNPPSITKSFSPTTMGVGGTAAVSFLITNPNVSQSLTGVGFTDTLPAGLVVSTPNGASNTCGGTVAATAGSGSIGLSGATLSGSSTCTLTVNVTPTTSGSKVNSVTVSSSNGGTGNTSTATLTVTPVADLSVTKTGPATINAGASISYTIVVSNAGPSAADGASFSDTVPAAITGVNASCGSPTGGAACGSVSTMGNSVTSTITTLPSGGSVTFTITGTAPASGSLSNTATVTVPGGTTDPNLENNSSTAGTTVNLIADLAITKSDGQATYTPTFPTTYTIVVTNNGPSNASGFNISDAVPAALTGLTINCTATGTASCGTNASSGNNVSFTGASLNSGGGNAITITVAGTVSGSATGNLTNTASLVIPQGAPFSDPTPGNNTATDTDGLQLQSDLAITKTNNVVSIVPGTTTTYTIVVTNNGPNAVEDASVVDTLPAGISGASWTCVTSSGGSCGAASGSGNINTTVDLPVGGTATFTVIAQVSTAATGTLTNTATVYAPCGVLDPTPNNNTATDSDTLTPQINLSLNMTVNNSGPEPGQAITYTLTLRNAGPSNATGVVVGDPLPPSLQFVSSSGNYNPQTGMWNVGNLPVGQTVTLTVTVIVQDSSAVNRAEVVSADQTDVNSTPDNQRDGEDDIAQIRLTTPKGPGLPYPGVGAMSDTRAGSILFFNYYTSNAANPNLENTRINITNAHPSMNTIVHLFFVDGATCSVADNYLCLTPNQTSSFTAADIDPGVAGYLVAVAVDELGCPINANCLIGDAYVKTAAGARGNLNAEAVAALRARPVECDANTSATTIVFDGVSYNRIPRALAVDSVPSREDGNRSFLVLNRIGGNLATGAATIGSLFGLLYNDTESAFSFNISASTCQLRQELSSSFPRTTPRFDQVIGGGRTGWMRIWGMDDGGILGSVLNVNANTAASSSAYAGAHNLHHLTSSTSVSLSIPVFPASCR